MKNSIKISISGAKFAVFGTNGQLYVYEDRVVITREGLISFLAVGHDDKKTIPMNDITNVQFRKGTSVLNGFVHFGIRGKDESIKNTFYAGQDENTVMIRKKDNDKGEQIKDFIDKKIIERGTGKTTVVLENSAVDEILKLKQLLDAGILTQEEFDMKKKQLLGL